VGAVLDQPAVTDGDDTSARRTVDSRWATMTHALDGEDLRPLPLGQRKPRLARLLARVQAGIALNEHMDAKGELVFRQACVMRLEGILSKPLTAPYRSDHRWTGSRSKNPDSPAMRRARAGLW
jgi:hypothetical protein